MFIASFLLLQGKLAEQGKLLMQGALYVTVEHKKAIRQRKMQRHVFLYEKLVLFCKKRGDIKEKTCYAFKSSIKVCIQLSIQFSAYNSLLS